MKLESVSIISLNGKEYLLAKFSDKKEVLCPLSLYPSLLSASDEERKNWKLIADGHGVRWPSLDLDLSAEGIIAKKTRYE